MCENVRNFLRENMQCSKRDVMTSYTNFQTQVGWELGSAVRAALKAAGYFYTQPGSCFISRVTPEAEQHPRKGGLRSQICARPLIRMRELCQHREHSPRRQDPNAPRNSSQVLVKEGWRCLLLSCWAGSDSFATHGL